MALIQCQPGRLRVLLKLILISLVLLAILGFLYPAYHTTSSVHRLQVQRASEGFSKYMDETGQYIDVEDSDEEDDKGQMYPELRTTPKQQQHIRYVERNSRKALGPPNPAEGVYVDHYKNEEIQIPQALRDELWPTRPPPRTVHHSESRQRVITPSGAAQTSGPYKLYVESIGQLGSQLFEFASVYGMSKALNRQPYINPGSILTALFSNITLGSAEMDSKVRSYMEDGPGVYSPHLYHSTGDMGVCCYLQSWRYFESYSRDIRAQLQFNKEISDSAQKIIATMTSQFKSRLTKYPTDDILNDIPAIRKDPKNYFHKYDVANNKTRGFHVTRIGVHVHSPRGSKKDHHRRRSRFQPTVPQAYFERAMQYFRSRHADALFFVVTDDEAWCRENLTLSYGDVVFAGHNAASVDLAVLSGMKHVISSVGALSWWGGWLAGGDVLYYPDWIQASNDAGRLYKAKDYYPPWWLSITVDNSEAE